MQHRIFIGALVACTWFAACETGAPSPPPGVQPDARKGFQIALVSCGQCHAFNPESVPQVAPRWHEIAEAYRGEREALAAFLDDPAAHGPRMASAVERFGPMPDMGLDRRQALHVAAQIAAALKPGVEPVGVVGIVLADAGIDDLDAHVVAQLPHRLVVDHAVGPREVDGLEDAQLPRGGRHGLAAFHA